MRYNQTETSEEAIIKHECGLQMQDKGLWMGTVQQFKNADDMLDAVARMEENEIDDILESRY